MKKAFTMIELIIVIVILGILASVAIPKFVNLKDDAEKAAIEGLVGAIRSAKNVFFSKMLLCGEKQYKLSDLENDPNLLNLFVSYQPQGDSRTFQCDSTGITEWSNFFEFKQSIRDSILKDPNADVGYKGEKEIQFVTKSGRTVTIDYDNNTKQIVWSANPSY